MRCLRAGIKAEQIIFSGVGKEEHEIEFALINNIKMISVEAAFELDLIIKVSKALNKVASIGFRFNPDVNPKTHPYISTGLKEHKFGLDESEILRLTDIVKSSATVRLIGVSFHVGSQIESLDPFIEAVQKTLSLIEKINLPTLKTISCGGGLGICYTDEVPPTLGEYAKQIKQHTKHTGLDVCIEPGRSIVGNVGWLLTKVLGVKQTSTKTFVVVDSAMNDLIRPSLYSAKHPVHVVGKEDETTLQVDVVGPVCESGDFLAKDIFLPKVEAGDLILIGGAGAYGFAMSSQYNSRPRAAEVLITKQLNAQLIRRRETLKDLTACEDQL